jgi:hypothetical protein
MPESDPTSFDELEPPPATAPRRAWTKPSIETLAMTETAVSVAKSGINGEAATSHS